MKKSAKKIIEELVLIGESYPKEKGGFLGIFQHTHQAAANKLINLNKSLDDGGLAAEIATIFTPSEFKISGSLLRKVINCLYESEAFAEFNRLIDDMNSEIKFANDNNDGGSTVYWDIKNDMQAIAELTVFSSASIEMHVTPNT